MAKKKKKVEERISEALNIEHEVVQGEVIDVKIVPVKPEEPKKRRAIPPTLKGVYEVLKNAKEPVWGQERGGWIVPRGQFDEVFAETTGIKWNRHMEPQMRLVPKTRRFGRFYEKTFVCNMVRLHLRS